MERGLPSRGFLVIGALVLAFFSGGDALAIPPPSPPAPASAEQIILWSSQGPVAVNREPAAHALAGPDQPDPERLLDLLLEGPTAEEREQGLMTAIPADTHLAAYLDGLEGTVIVRLQMPEVALHTLGHDAFEILVQQIGKTLLPVDWRDIHIQVQDPTTGDFVPLAEFLPQVIVPVKPSASSGATASAPPLIAGQPPAPGQTQPTGALSGKTVYVSAGHGWEWNDYKDQWLTQRPPYPSSGYNSGPIVEDHNNAESVDQYLLHYLWNAGAQVWPVRERDMNAAEAIVDDGDAGYSAPGWSGVSGGYAGDSDHKASVTGPATATASWEAYLPSDGQYAVYVWYESGGDRPWDAQYTVHHAGGQTTVLVDQRHHGYTWHYIGTYGFLSGDAARVSLSNQCGAADRTVVADAVRFGGGTFDSLSGIDTVAPGAPGRPWWEVSAYYYTQRMGMAAGYGDVTVRPVYARWEHAGTGDDAVYVSWHSNGVTGYAQWNYSGTESYVHNGDGLPRTAGSLQLQDTIHNEVIHDIRTGWDAGWVDRGQRQANLGELRLLWDEDNSSNRLPGTLIEIGFHDHPGDTDALKEPRFNQLVARAVYQGVVKYWNPSAPLLPEPPTALSVVNLGGGEVRVSWVPSPTDGLGLTGDAATGYRVYTSPNGVGWSNGIPVSSGTQYIIGGLPLGQLLFVRVSATNAGGESFPTETLAVRVGDAAETLIVNGFDRLNRSMLVLDNETVEGPNMRMFLDRMNRFDYAVQHGESIPQHLAFDGATNGAVRTGRVNLNNYTIVDWILGEESTTDQTLDATERSLVRAFLEGDGALFISGSEIGYHLDYAGADPSFYNNVLHADFAGDDAATYQVAGVSGSAFDGVSFSFDAPGMYDADYPDQMYAYGSQDALHYQGGNWGTAAVQYASGCERVVMFGFPFETIWPASQRTAVMAAVFGFLDECLNPTVETSIDTPTYGSAHNVLPEFAGSAYAEHASLSHVEVQVQNSSTGEYWNGSHWATTASWLDATGGETWSYQLPASLPQGSYQLRARGRATNGSSDDTPAETMFIYDTIAPPPTTLITPTGGVTVTALPELVLDWADVAPDGGSDISYRVELDGEAWTASDSSYSVAGVPDGPHTWRVRVQDDAGNASAWTGWGTFAVTRHHVWLPLIARGPGGEAPCSDLVVNGGFETDAGWLFNPEEGYDTYVTDPVHSGQRSALVGHDPAPYSSVRQQIALPEGGTATLRLWIYPISENNDPDDLHYVWLRDQSGRSNPLELTTSDAREWRQGEYDLTPYMGQTVTIYVGAVNDGDGHTASLYVDDVELLFCP